MKYKAGDVVRYVFDGVENIEIIADVMTFLSRETPVRYVMNGTRRVIDESKILGYAPGAQKTEAKPLDSDPVNNPSHYTKGAVECIDAMQSALSHEQFVGFLKGQIIKYTWRCDHKANSIQDIEKAIWYAKKLVDALI